MFHAQELGNHAQGQGSLAVFKVTARDQVHYKGPSGAFVTYCNISCFISFLLLLLLLLLFLYGTWFQGSSSVSVFLYQNEHVGSILPFVSLSFTLNKFGGLCLEILALHNVQLFVCTCKQMK